MKQWSYLLLFLSFSAFGQKTKVLENITIVSPELSYLSGQHLDKMDSAVLMLYTGTTITESLDKVSYATIRQYGINGLSGLSIRGMGSNHTSLLWNGISIAPPSSGSVDFSQIKLTGNDAVIIQYGGNGNAFGSGNMGGAVLLNSSAPQKNALSLNQSFGSFGKVESVLKLDIKRKKYASQNSIYYSKAENDFEFNNTHKFNAPVEKMEHARSKQFGFQHHSFFDLGEQNEMSARLWYHDNAIQIPSVASSYIPSDATQKDKSFRALVEFKNKGLKRLISARSAYLYDQLNYENPTTALSSQNKTNQWVNQLKYDYFLNDNSSFSFSGQYKHEWAIADGYGSERQKRDNVSANLGYQYASNLNLNLSIGQEYVNGQHSPLLFSINATSNNQKPYMVKGSVSKTFRFPSFNDLFWVGEGASGNKELLPEEGISSDLGFIYNISNNNSPWSWNINPTLFYNQSKNWVVWVPEGNSNFWIPKNITNVKSWGVEAGVGVLWKQNHKQFTSDLKYSLTKTEIIKSANASDIGKPLTHTPQHQLRWVNQVNLNSLFFRYEHRFIGEQFNSYTNTDLLEPYFVGDLQLGYQNHNNAVHWKTAFTTNNVWNTAYEVRKGYPMPGRNYKITLIIII